MILSLFLSSVALRITALSRYGSRTSALSCHGLEQYDAVRRLKMPKRDPIRACLLFVEIDTKAEHR